VVFTNARGLKESGKGDRKEVGLVKNLSLKESERGEMQLS